MGKQIMTDAGDLPIAAHYQNEDLKRVIERFEQRRQTAVVELDTEEMFSDWENGRRPFLYDPLDKTFYTGREGGHHLELFQTLLDQGLIDKDTEM
jgi:hypothetical protein